MPTWAKPRACSILPNRNTGGVQAWSDVDAEVGRLQHHDVLQVEEMATEHLEDDRHHVEEEKAGEREARPPPALHEIREVGSLHPAAEGVEGHVAGHEVADHH